MKIEFIKNISKTEATKLIWGTSSHDFYLDCSVKDIKELFGMYGASDPYKVKAQWVLLFFVDTDEGAKVVPITIYDYKEYDTKLRDIRDWHIGNFAKDNKEVALIVNWINEEIRKRKANKPLIKMDGKDEKAFNTIYGGVNGYK